ncbi:MAG TPA: 3-oxoacyl-ACP synthase [Deinococcales bacterium]|nr:3-oxoacyl-ACP synthase [Deinococcales bacterium]
MTPAPAGPSVGLLATAVYLPEGRITAAEIASASGLPLEVVREKLGLHAKPIPGPDDHTNAMGVFAARKAVRRAGIDPLEVDAVVCMTEEYKEYPLWTAGIDLAYEVGAHNAWAFDVGQKCGTFVLALKLARALIAEDERVNTVLVAGGYRNGDLVDYQDATVRFMYNLGAGGGAAIVRRDHHAKRLMGSSIVTDGSFSRDVRVPVGGTCEPFRPENAARFKLEVPDPAGMKERLEMKSLSNFNRVVREAAERSGFEAIDYLAILHMKPSAHKHILRGLGLREDQAVYLSDYGHIGQVDQLLSLELAEERGLLRPGSRVVMAAAGVGYVWNACGMVWG